jgi:branched-chain amino acid transport system substrate-binding protein
MKLPVANQLLTEETGMKMIRESAEGGIGIDAYVLGMDTEKARKFEESFHKNSIGQEWRWPVSTAMESYYGMKMFFDAIRKAGSFETEKIINVFEGMDWEGPVGKITMRKQDHQAQLPLVICGYAPKTKYFDFPYVKPIKVIPAEDVSVTLEDSGWKLH